MNMNRSPMTCCPSPCKLGNALYVMEAPVPTLFPSYLLLFLYTPSHTELLTIAWTHHTLVFFHDTTVKNVFLPCLSALTSNALSLKPSQTHLVCPLELYYYTYVICLHEQLLYKSIVKKLWGLKASEQNRTDGLMQKPRMDLRDVLGYNTRKRWY